MTDGPALRLTPSARRLQARATGLLRAGETLRALSLLDRYLDAVAPHVCVPGCAACCDHWVDDVSPLEIQVLVEWLSVHLPGQLQEVGRRCADDARVFHALEGDAHTAFFALHRPCPLLAPDHTCQAWPARPLTCRTFFATLEGEPGRFPPGRECDGTTSTFFVHPGDEILVLLGASGGGLRDQLARILA